MFNSGRQRERMRSAVRGMQYMSLREMVFSPENGISTKNNIPNSAWQRAVYGVASDSYLWLVLGLTVLTMLVSAALMLDAWVSHMWHFRKAEFIIALCICGVRIVAMALVQQQRADAPDKRHSNLWATLWFHYIAFFCNFVLLICTMMVAAAPRIDTPTHVLAGVVSGVCVGELALYGRSQSELRQYMIATNTEFESFLDAFM